MSKKPDFVIGYDAGYERPYNVAAFAEIGFDPRGVPFRSLWTSFVTRADAIAFIESRGGQLMCEDASPDAPGFGAEG